MRRTASFFLIWNAICVHVDSCTFPSVLEGKTWEDSDKGRPVTFSGNVMLGWNVTAFTTVMNQWECLFNQNNIIVSKSSFVFEPLFPGFTPTTYYVYICMWIVSLDSDKFIYYLLADFVSDLNTRAYKDTNDNLGPCDVCKLSLSLDPADAEVMTSTGNFPQISQSYSPVTCDSVLQTTVLSSTTTTSKTSEEPSSSESTSTVAVTSNTPIKSTDSSTTSASRETHVSSTETTIGPTTTKATTIESTIGSTTTETTIELTTTETTAGSTTTETTAGSTTTEATVGSTTTEATVGSTTTEATVGSTTTEATVGSTTTETTVGSTTTETTVGSTTKKTTTFGSTMLHTESTAKYATTKLSTPKSTTLRLNIVPSTTGYTIDSEKMILPLMSNEAFITMVICGGLVVLVIVFITIIGVYSSLKSRKKPKNIRHRHNYHKYLTP